MICPVVACGGELEPRMSTKTLMGYPPGVVDANRVTENYQCRKCGSHIRRVYKWEKMADEEVWKFTPPLAQVPPEKPSTVREWQKTIHDYANEKGWWDEPRSLGDILALIHSELSEALEEYRNGHPINEVRVENGKPEGVPVEVADAVIRVLDYFGKIGVDLQAVLEQKHAYNLTRPHRHGGKVI